MLNLLTQLSLVLISITPVALAQTRVADLAAKYTLTASSTLPFPTATQANSDAQLTVNSWGKIQYGADNVEFVQDPFPNGTIPTASPNDNVSGPVLRVKYGAGTFSEHTGGLGFFHQTDGYESMMLTYEVAFDSFFDWVKGGKLPGLRGGSNGCSGGVASDGNTCFSMRTMWRRSGAGEAYAYVPPFNGLCNSGKVLCNQEFGVSIGRSDFGFISGKWNRVTVLVQMNNPPDVANGYLEVYYNDLIAITQRNLVYRRKSSLQADAVFFSTFFGGNDSSWAPQSDTHTYFRNIQYWGGSTPSTLTGDPVNGSIRLETNGLFWTVVIGLGLFLSC